MSSDSSSMNSGIRILLIVSLVVSSTIGCSRRSHESQTLTEARRGFVTEYRDPSPPGTAAPRPPEGVFELARYAAPPGAFAAYVSPPPATGGKHPAILWLGGGFDNGIDEGAWRPAPESNDQSARAFREAGIVLFLPSLRGGNDNPGKQELLLGEVDDVVAATKYVEQLSYVDPKRIYLGGHSTGGTLALLVAEALPERFRAVFAFGPVADVGSYDLDFPTLSRIKETRVRSPVHFLSSIRSPTFIIEGTQSANIRSFAPFAQNAHGAPVKTVKVHGADHFNVLAPVSRLLAKKILADGDASPGITLTEAEATSAFAR